MYPHVFTGVKKNIKSYLKKLLGDYEASLISFTCQVVKRFMSKV